MFASSLGKKYLMAISGFVLVGFVFVHMAGNLQILLGQENINAYAHALQSLPLPILWGSRLFLILAVVVHAVTAYQLVKENRAARPDKNDVEKTQRAGIASLKMGLTGTILLFFIVFHLLHFTVLRCACFVSCSSASNPLGIIFLSMCAALVAVLSLTCAAMQHQRTQDRTTTTHFPSGRVITISRLQRSGKSGTPDMQDLCVTMGVRLDRLML